MSEIKDWLWMDVPGDVAYGLVVGAINLLPIRGWLEVVKEVRYHHGGVQVLSPSDYDLERRGGWVWVNPGERRVSRSIKNMFRPGRSTRRKYY